MRVGGDALQRILHRRRQSARSPQLLLVAGELGRGGQLAMDQQIRDLFELSVLGEVENIVAAIMQVVALAADGAQAGVAGGDARDGNPIFRPRGCGGWGRRFPGPPGFSFAKSSSSAPSLLSWSWKSSRAARASSAWTAWSWGPSGRRNR